jgi:protein phosphatase PTC2/3
MSCWFGISVPEIKTHTLTHEDEFMVVACDGLWDVVSSARVVELARLHLQQKNDPDSCARYLVSTPLAASQLCCSAVHL